MSPPRPVDLARLSLGAIAVTRPGLFLRMTEGADGRGERVTVRILGARYLVQSSAGLALTQRWSQAPGRPWARSRVEFEGWSGGRPWVPEVDAAVDVVHAATMLALAAVAPTRRRLALLSAATAVGFAAADLREKMR